MATFTYSREAENDIDESVLYIARDNVAAATRLNAAIEQTATDIAKMPQMGRSIPSSTYPSLRVMPVNGFSHYFLFYIETKGGIHIARFLHGARDITALLNP